ncbi:MAG: site-specific integrase [Prevotellaceae bacterium]|jgi:integrase|nr:site-specific integrase [Prevotellaceae bacterium]
MKSQIVLEKHKKPDGTFPVKLRINLQQNKKQCQIFISTGIAVSENNFCNGAVVGINKAKIFNSIITNKKIVIDKLLLDLELQQKLKQFTPQTLKKYLSGDNETNNQPNVLLFKDFVEKYIEKYDNKKTLQTYITMLQKVGDFANLQTLTFENINLAWVKDFDIFMSKNGQSTNTRSIYMRCLRAVYNDAIDREIVPLNTYPFRRFSIKQATTKHRNMSIEDLRELINLKLSPVQSRYRDMFLLSFYFCGLNFKDMLFLTEKEVKNGIIDILRAKTETHINLRIEPEAQTIIDRYKGKNYLINPLDTWNNYENFLKKTNKYLRSFFPYLSVYWARHTWATLAAELDIPDNIIDLAMGHKLKGMSDTYIKRNRTKIYEANRKVINYVLSKS